MKVCGWLTGLVVLIASGVDAHDRLALRVSPAVAFAPANLSVRATVQADAANRSIEIVAESADFYRSSEIQLEGDSAPRTTTFQFRSLPTGEYSVRGILRGQGGREITTVETKVNIVDNGAALR
jgi:hypothetical protein